MAAPAPASQSQLITVERGQELIAQITRDDHEVAWPLFQLLRGLVDPDDSTRFSICDDLMRQVILKTPQFEEWYKSQLVA